MSRSARPRMIRSAAMATLAVTLVATTLLPGRPASAEEGVYFPPVTDATVRKECSACHMAFPPGMLPARSWTALMGNLSNHFGEDASLDDKTRRTITDWLVANAAPPRSPVARSIPATETPLRITETQWWLWSHQGEVRPGAFRDPRVKSKANCAACHFGAELGQFEGE